MVDLTKQGLTDMLNGATLYGSGGGGPYAMGVKVIDDIIKSGKTPTVVAPEDVADDDWCVIAAGVGSPNAAASFDPSVVCEAVTDLGKAMGVTMKYVMAAEIGAGNTFMPLYVASQLGLGAVDGAGSSRAVPAITMSKFAAEGVPVRELMVANTQKKVGLIVGTAAEASAPMRAVISDPAFGQVAGLAIWPMQGKDMKRSIIPGTYGMAQKLGTILREAAADEKVNVVCELLGGRVLGVGTLTDTSETTGGGFDMGECTVKLADGANLVILNKNENLIAWRSDQSSPVTIAPDLVSYMLKDGTVFSNVELENYKGKEIVVIAAPAGPEMRNPSIVEAFRETLATMGYPGPATPLGDL